MATFKYKVFYDCHIAIRETGLIEGALQILNPNYRGFQAVPTVGHPNKKNGWVKLNPDGTFICGNWESGMGAIFSHEKVFAREKQLPSEKIDPVTYDDGKKALETRYAEKARLAWAFLKDCEPISPSNPHPYLRLKKITPVANLRETTIERFEQFFGYYPKGARAGRLLVVPMVYQGKLASLQLITEQGDKAYLSGGRAGGAFWYSHKVKKPKYIAIGEGVATVLSYLQHHSENILGIAAMSAGNLPKVAVSIRAKFPRSIIILCGDNDKSGTGQKFARRAQRMIAGKSIIKIPAFTANDKKLFQLLTQSDKEPSDWNDFYLIRHSKIGGGNTNDETR